MTDWELAYGMLFNEGEKIAEDVKDTYPDARVEYDMYVEDGIDTELPKQVFGLIDMGDMGKWAFILVEGPRHKLRWEDASPYQPDDIKRRILAKRSRNPMG